MFVVEESVAVESLQERCLSVRSRGPWIRVHPRRVLESVLQFQKLDFDDLPPFSAQSIIRRPLTSAAGFPA